MKETFIIKHAVGGKIYLDTSKRALDYRIVPAGEGWHIAVQVPFGDEIREILDVKKELNVFLFREYDDRPTLKTWYYVSDGPVDYDEERGILTITAASSIEYVPDHFQN